MCPFSEGAVKTHKHWFKTRVLDDTALQIIQTITLNFMAK